ncbi:MAG: tetratricopeptide repeat protein [Pseudomonadota bacterium]
MKGTRVRPMLRTLAAVIALGLPALPATGQEADPGAFLAARVADRVNDYAEAARQYRRALLADPGNLPILRSAAVTTVAAGEIERAVPMAEMLFEAGASDELTPLLLLVRDVRAGNWAEALAVLDRSEEAVNPLLGGLIRAWIQVALDDAEGAIEQLADLDQNEAMLRFAQYHTALIQALSGDLAPASATLEGGEEGEPLRLNRGTVIVRAELLAATGDREGAIGVLEDALALGFGDVELAEMRDRLARGETLDFARVGSPAEGVAEVLFNFADALGDDRARRALVYSRLATYLSPGFTEALIRSSEILEDQEQFALAIETYAQVPQGSPQFLSAERGRAQALRADDRADEAIGVLTGLNRSYPEEILVLYDLGELLREAERYEESAEVLTRAIDLIGEPETRHWLFFYTRAIAHERAGDWEQAEPDFRRALELEEDQPLVLNYLGYTLVERREKLDEALAMIERAVEQRPESGFITDSLGWVLYRLERFEEAVAPMERAVELEPTDPVINDHLGDVYWKVGREREAIFQWRRALSFDPETEEADRIRRKLEVGLDEVLEEEAAAETEGRSDDGG